MPLDQQAYNELLLSTSFVISIISAAFGIAKLLKNGPIKMIRKDGKIGGYGTPGFVLLMVAVAGNMIGKASWVAWVFAHTGCLSCSTAPGVVSAKPFIPMSISVCVLSKFPN